MSNPFVVEKEFNKDLRDEQIGPAWFQRDHGQWEHDAIYPLLSGGTNASTLKKEILSIINKAEEVIAICSFLLSDEELQNAILEASDRGVRVYILTASKKRLQKDSTEETPWKKKIRVGHEELLNALCSKTLLRDANIHSKFILADPKTRKRRGVLSTANFTTDAFLHPELGIVLGDQQIEELFNIFVSVWWELGERELLQPEELRDARKIVPPITQEIDHVISSLKNLVITYPDRSTTLKEEIGRLFREARNEVFVTTFGISDDDSFIDELRLSAINGVKIKILTRQRTSTTPLLHELCKIGAEVRGLNSLHAKVILTETEHGKEALIMTANLERISLQDGFEVGILVRDNVAKDILRLLNHWWDNANWEYLLYKKLGEHLGTYLVLNDREFEIHEVEETKPISLGEQLIEDIASLESFQPKFPDVNDAHRAIFTWTTRPRQLPKKCKPHKIEGLDESINVWKCDKNRIYISVSNQEELDRVLKIPWRPNVPILYHKN